MNKTSLLTAERLREVLAYNPGTGVLTRLVRTANNIQIGDAAGYIRPDGYSYVRVDTHQYLAHRLIWLHVHGRWPTDQIDHINGCHDDNRLCNLREASPGENNQNVRQPRVDNKSGFIGAKRHKRRKNKIWQAVIGVNGKRHSLGYFSTAELAHAAYLKAKRELHSHGTI